MASFWKIWLVCFVTHYWATVQYVASEITQEGDDLSMMHLEDTTSQVELKTETPPKSTMKSRDCMLYDGSHKLKQIKHHNEIWNNSESDCERCKCTNGETRCYYYYCNVAQLDYITPPSDDSTGSGVLPWKPPSLGLPRVGNVPEDDEDMEQSGMMPWELLQEYKHNIPANVVDPTLCRNRKCKKSCRYGLQVDLGSGCSLCKCAKCPSLGRCNLECNVWGFERDGLGCKKCHCRRYITDSFATEDDIVLVDDFPTNSLDQTYNKTKSRTNDEKNDASYESSDNSLTRLHNILEERDRNWKLGFETPSGVEVRIPAIAEDEWHSLILILVPVLVVLLLSSALVYHFWRRYHRDKYDIKTIRPTHEEAVKLQPVKTLTEDHPSISHV